nr:unnamed protein product [Digitaria exilis]
MNCVFLFLVLAAQCCLNLTSQAFNSIIILINVHFSKHFRRFMNQYFLLIACLQLWSRITPVSPVTTWGPLIIIFIVSASKEAWDDYNRYLSDKKANERNVWVVKDGVRRQIKAQDIHVGDIVWLHENDEIPCDLVLIGTSDPQGICYIETSALDGETDLKPRIVPPISANMSVEQLEKVKGIVECPNPDNDIRRFDANMRLFLPSVDNEKCPLTINNTLLQSCYLRYTEWACGVAVYTGNETKSGMSRGTAEPKLTAADAMIDKLTIAIFMLQIVVVLVLGYFGNIWKHTKGLKQWYLMYPAEGPWYGFLVIPLRFELLCSIMIPISIKVTLDLAKGVYAKFIDWDEQMFDWETNTPAHSANTAISEDLGQVEYILSDKTGTLTENRMIFKRCCINNIMYGNDNGDALKDARLLNAVSSNDPDIVKFLMAIEELRARSFKIKVPNYHHLAVGHNDDTVSYKAQSQDEEALVNAASNLNMMLISKDSSTAEICFNGSKFKYELLDVLEFTSDRKRMSVVVKEGQTGKILLLSKGADEAILPRVYPGTRHLFQPYLLSKIAEVCDSLERDLHILGVTAIEDRLQCGTSVDLEPNSQLLSISGKTEQDILRSLERALLITKNTCETKLVAILKSVGYLTLAIGDGGNDVRMIQEANIGVGISGREGLQAARAADYSIGTFSIQALVIFFITICAYADEKSEMQELSMVALSGCIWLQAFVVMMDSNSFTSPQIILIWGNFVAFYMINLILSAVPSLQLYTIMFRLCGQPSYWITMALTVAVAMVPVMAFRYFRNLYWPSPINILQQIEQSNGSIQPSRNVGSALKPARTNLTNLLTGSRGSRGSSYQPLLSDSAESTR